MIGAGDPDAGNSAAEAVDLVAVLLIAFAIAVFFYLIHIVLLPFVFSAALALVLSPAVDWLARATRAPRLAAALVIFSSLAGLIAFAAWLALPPLLAQGVHIIAHLQEFVERPIGSLLGDGPIQILGQSTSASDIASAAVARLRTSLQSDGSVTAFAAGAFGGAFGVFLTLTLLAYFLADGARVVKGLLWLFPPGWRPAATRIVEQLQPILLRYFAGIAAVILYAGVAAYLDLDFGLGLHHAAFLAALTGFLEVLPVIGPALSALIAGLVAIQQAKSMWSIAAYVIYASALRLSIDQLVGPVVLGKAGRVHPTLVIFCFLAGGALFGVIGVILAVPVALSVKVALATIYGEPLRDEKTLRSTP
jgi:predicted PurR-regulated permease PerM